MLHLDDLKPNVSVNYTVLFILPRMLASRHAGLTAFARQTQTGAEILPPRPCGGKNINPFLLTMPDNRFWAIGESVGSAWDAGKAVRKQ